MRLATIVARRFMANAFITNLKQQFPTLDFQISVRAGSMTLGKVVVPKDARGQGLGAAFMMALTQEADRLGMRIELSPSTDFGGSSVARLKRFYKRFGFVENKGRHKDFAISASMYRTPTGA